MNNILHTVPSIELATGGGLGNAALQLHQQMRAMGVRSRLITTSDSAEHQSSDSSHVEFLPIKRNPFFYGSENQRTIETAVRNSELVHCHGLYTHLNWCVGDSCKKFSRTLVYHPHGTLAPWYLRNRRILKKCVHFLFENRNFKQVRLWRAVSDSEALDIRNFFPRATTTVVPNGIHLSDFRSQPIREKESLTYGDPNRKWLLFFGRIAKVKGLEVLLKAWKQLQSYHKDWQLLIVGSDFDGYTRSVENWISEFPSSSKPLMLGPRVGLDKVNLLNAADLFVLPSLAEGLPLTVLEAVACHVPVILSKACNYTPEQIGESGWVVQSGLDPLVSALDAAFSEDDSTRQKRGIIGRSIVEQEFNWERVCRLLEKATQEMC